jgi:hypothetical protein
VAGFIAAKGAAPCVSACWSLPVSRMYKVAPRGRLGAACRGALNAVEIARLFAAHRGRYRLPGITADLRDAAWRVSAKTPSLRSRASAASGQGRSSAATPQGGRAQTGGGRPGLIGGISLPGKRIRSDTGTARRVSPTSGQALRELGAGLGFPARGPLRAQLGVTT